MSNYLKNVFAFARPTTSAQAMTLSKHPNGEFTPFYPINQAEQKKADKGKESPR